MGSSCWQHQRGSSTVVVTLGKFTLYTLCMNKGGEMKLELELK